MKIWYIQYAKRILICTVSQNVFIEMLSYLKLLNNTTTSCKSLYLYTFNEHRDTFTFISITVCRALVFVDSGAASYLLCSSWETHTPRWSRGDMERDTEEWGDAWCEARGGRETGEEGRSVEGKEWREGWIVGVVRGDGAGNEGECWREAWTEEVITKEGWWGGQEEGTMTGWVDWRWDGEKATGKEGEERSGWWREGEKWGEGWNWGDTWKGGGIGTEGETGKDGETGMEGVAGIRCFPLAAVVALNVLGSIRPSHILHTEVLTPVTL